MCVCWGGQECVCMLGGGQGGGQECVCMLGGSRMCVYVGGGVKGGVKNVCVGWGGGQECVCMLGGREAEGVKNSSL